MKRNYRVYENLEKGIFQGEGEYDIPVLKPEIYTGEHEWIGFNYARGLREQSGKCVHFFLDDYQFNVTWTMPAKYVDMMRRFDYVLTPDFSLYTDFPKAVQIFNHYRKHWYGAYLQETGEKVIPTISWSDAGSFAWCFDGEPKGGTVAVSSVGVMNDRDALMRFLYGYEAMKDFLHPESIIFYGNIPNECEKDNIIPISPFHERFEAGRRK